MFSKTMLLTMFAYNDYINRELLDIAAKVTAEQWAAPQDFGQRSLHETLFHLLVVEEEWFYLCEHGTPIWDYRKIEDYPDVASLRAFSDKMYPIFRTYLESLDDTKLTSTLYATMPHGVDKSVTILHMLTHTLFHSAQHRSEVAVLLTRYGQSPEEIDFLGFGDWGKALP